MLSERLRKDEILSTLVLDCKNAFMSVPLERSEQRFNCAQVADLLKMSRPKLDPQEYYTGRFVVLEGPRLRRAPEPSGV